MALGMIYKIVIIFTSKIIKLYTALCITSIIGLDAKTFLSTWVSVSLPPTQAKYRMAYLADTVLPAPDSPLTVIIT